MAAATVVLVLAAQATAGPISGDYTSTDLGGPNPLFDSVTPGRWTEGFVGGLPNNINNGAHALSFGGVPGAEWELTGPWLASTTVISGPALPPAVGVVTITYERVFDVTSGQLILKNTGPWWNAGDPGTQYVVNLSSYVQTLIVTYANMQIANASSVEIFAGTFAGYPGYELLYGHTLGAYEDVGIAPPPGYPAFEGNGVVVGGAWGVAEGIRFSIVPEPATMALVGLGLGAIFIRRKKSA